MSINVEVKINYDNDELFCQECKNRIEIGEKFVVILEELLEDEIERKPVHLDCLEETFEEDEEFPEPLY